MTYCRVYCVSSLLLGCTTLSKVMDGGSASLTLKGRATGAPSEGEGTPGVHGFLIKAPLTWCLAVQTMPPDGLAHPQILGDGMAGGQGPSVIPSPGGQSSFSGRTFTWSHPGVSHNTTRSRVLACTVYLLCVIGMFLNNSESQFSTLKTGMIFISVLIFLGCIPSSGIAVLCYIFMWGTSYCFP